MATGMHTAWPGWTGLLPGRALALFCRAQAFAENL